MADHVYVLGAVKPWVKDAAYEIGNMFDVATIYGVAARAGASDHPSGHALDFMVNKDRAKGDAIAGYVKANWGRLNIKYIIWQQRIDEGSGWKPMEDRGSPTANHMDHDHVSFTDLGSGKDYSGGGTFGDTAGTGGGGIGDALATLSNQQTWIRVLEFIAGIILLAIMLWPIVQGSII